MTEPSYGVDSLATLHAFGYLPSSLSSGSHKRVAVTCAFCRTLFFSIRKNLNRRPGPATCSKCSEVSKAYRNSASGVDPHEFWISKRPQIDLSFIDVQATLDKFGYTSLDTSVKTDKRVVAKCEFCLAVFETSLMSVHRSQKHVCCRECSGIAAQFRGNVGKHEFYLSRADSARKQLGRVSSAHPSSDKSVKVACDFCHEVFEKPIKYVRRGVVACRKCSGVCAQYSKRGRGQDKHEFWLSLVPQIDWALVDIDETVRKHGHDPRGFGSGTHRKVVVRCCFCGERTEADFAYLAKVKGRKTCAACKHKKNVETIQKRYGVNSVLEIPGVVAKSSNPLTEQIVETILRDRYKIGYARSFEVPICVGKSYSFDFFIPSCNLLIECQGDYFHDFKRNGYSGTPKDRAKASFVETHTGFKLVHIWEHEIHLGRVSKILDYHIHGATEPRVVVGRNSDVAFRKISDKEAHGFLSQYHYLGNLGTISTCYGGFLNDDLICVCTFGGTTRQNTFKKVKTITGHAFGTKQLKELRRFCIKPGVQAKRFASFAIRQFVELFKTSYPNTKAVISFADPTVGDSGSIYKYAGWSKLKDTGKSYHYLDMSVGRMVHKKTVWDMARSAHMTERDFATSSNLLRVAEESKMVWIKIFQN